MSLMDQVRIDVHDIVTNLCDWGVDMTFVAPNAEEALVQGIHTKHHLALNEDGVPFNDRVASVAVSDASFPDIYPLYNAEKDVKLRGHLVKVKDSTGLEFTFVIKEWFPDRTLGLIVCILGDYQ